MKPTSEAQVMFEVYRRRVLLGRHALDRPTTIGRQRESQEPLGAITEDSSTPGEARLAIEASSESSISRQHLRLCPIDDRQISVESPSGQALSIKDGPPIEPGSRQVVPLPCSLTFGPQQGYGVRVILHQEEFRSLPHPAPKPGQLPKTREVAAARPYKMDSTANDSVGDWLRAIIDVLHSAVSTEAFFQQAAEAIVKLIDLDSGRVLLRTRGVWRLEAGACLEDLSRPPNWPPSNSILDEVYRTKSTVWNNVSTSQSQSGFQSFVAAPILDRAGQVLGAIYGDRRQKTGRELSILPLEAQLAETLAYGVSVGLERLHQEKEVAKHQVRFEQFFGSRLANQLARQPDLLEGRDADTTLLFCDIRGFSRVSQLVGTQTTMRWIGDVMQALSECILRHDGVVVDYIGDEVFAMWGAPIEQPDQALRACRAALDMLRIIPNLNDRWRIKLNYETDLGIGINSGLAQVGNIGSEIKFKYGPLGHSVNLASRVQGINKFLKTRLLVTQATFQRLPPEFLHRRLCAVRVVNLSTPVELIELRDPSDEAARTLFPMYAQALEEFESQRFHEAVRTLGMYLPNYPDDMPSRVLLSRTVNQLVAPSEVFDRVWEVPGK